VRRVGVGFSEIPGLSHPGNASSAQKPLSARRSCGFTRGEAGHALCQDYGRISTARRQLFRDDKYTQARRRIRARRARWVFRLEQVGHLLQLGAGRSAGRRRPMAADATGKCAIVGSTGHPPCAGE
jgi:hypothetical protein